MALCTQTADNCLDHFGSLHTEADAEQQTEPPPQALCLPPALCWTRRQAEQAIGAANSHFSGTIENTCESYELQI